MFVFSKFSSPRGNTFVASLGPKGNEGRKGEKKGKKKGEGRGREGQATTGRLRVRSWLTFSRSWLLVSLLVWSREAKFRVKNQWRKDRRRDKLWGRETTCVYSEQPKREWRNHGWSRKCTKLNANEVKRRRKRRNMVGIVQFLMDQVSLKEKNVAHTLSDGTEAREIFRYDLSPLLLLLDTMRYWLFTLHYYIGDFSCFSYS